MENGPFFHVSREKYVIYVGTLRGETFFFYSIVTRMWNYSRHYITSINLEFSFFISPPPDSRIIEFAIYTHRGYITFTIEITIIIIIVFDVGSSRPYDNGQIAVIQRIQQLTFAFRSFF